MLVVLVLTVLMVASFLLLVPAPGPVMMLPVVLVVAGTVR